MKSENLFAFILYMAMLMPYLCAALFSFNRARNKRPWKQTLVYWTGFSLFINSLGFLVIASYFDYFVVDYKRFNEAIRNAAAWTSWGLALLCSYASAFMLHWSKSMDENSPIVELLKRLGALKGVSVDSSISRRSKHLLIASIFIGSFCALRLLLR